MAGGQITPEAECTIESSEDWILTVTHKAQSKHPAVSERVRATLEQSLKGQLSDRRLTSRNLKAIATKLLAEQAHQHPESEETQ